MLHGLLGAPMSALRSRATPRIAGLAALALAAAAGTGCQNWDLKRPQESAPASRSFTPIGEEAPGPLTSDVAMRRLEGIERAAAQERLALVASFMDEFREARLIPQVHRLAGEAHLEVGQPVEAADAFERALVLTRTDVLGIPLDTALPLQLAMARFSAGQAEQGTQWLARTSIADRGPNVMQALRWAHAEQVPSEPLDDWLRKIREPLLQPAPAFTLPGLQQERVSLAQARGTATLINFWSPT